MLDLPNVTLLLVETRAHKITERVIADCISKVNFGEILLFTDKPDLIRFDPDRKARTVLCPNFPDKKQAGQFYYQHACAQISTDFALMLEWDAGIHDVTKWRPEFLEYDYIGAPWNVRPKEQNCLDVGNGGFMLMSKKLGLFLTEHGHDFPVYTDIDVGRTFRARLEDQGFKWPNRILAGKFSWELVTRDPDNFGFHGTFTWPEMLSREEVATRARLMAETPYLISKMPDLVKHAPWLQLELGDDDLWAKISRGGRPNYNTTSMHQRAKMNQIISQRRLFYASQAQRTGLKA